MKITCSLLAVFLGGLTLFGLAGCSSSPYVKPEVIANSDRTLKTPAWALNSQSMMQDGSDLVYIHKMYPSADVRPDACITMARTQAAGEMMKFIKTAIS